ncbi:MAG: replicative DNA helicase [Bdellovibrionales bacterium]|nr:replicative DNA helicase [Bdellovibrionales bacterium]
MAEFNPNLPPQNIEAEQSVLGGILIDNQTFHKVVDVVLPDDFYRPAHGKIYNAMRDLAAKGDPIDVVSLTSKMKELDIYEEAGGASYLAELLERVPTAVNSEYHAKLVSDQALKRRLVSACNELATKGMDPTEKPLELLDEAEKTIFGLSSTKGDKSMAPVRDIVRSAFVELEKRFENQDDITGIPSGYIELDKMTAGLQRTDMIIIACRPSMGKTSFALGAARHAAVHAKVPVVFFSLEMSKESIVTRLLAAEAKVDQHRIRTGKLTEQDWSKLTRAAGALSEAPIYIDDTPALTVLEMRGKARRLKAEVGDIGLIIVDYLQIMGTPKAESREKAISDISRSLKALAKELDAPVIALSQLNRNIDLRQDKRPMLADLRESGAIEQDADLIIFIHREDIEAMAQPNVASVAEFIIGKHRNGPRGTVKVAWLGQYASFENLAPNAPLPDNGPIVTPA